MAEQTRRCRRCGAVGRPAPPGSSALTALVPDERHPGRWRCARPYANGCNLRAAARRAARRARIEAMKAVSAAATLPREHGSQRGYAQHLRAHERVCAACSRAHQAYAEAYNARKRAERQGRRPDGDLGTVS